MSYRDDEDKKAYNKMYYQQQKLKGRYKKATTADQDKQLYLSGVRLPASLIGRLNQTMIDAERGGEFVWRNRSALVEDLMMRGLETFAGEGIEAIDEALPFLRATRATKSIGVLRQDAQIAFASVTKEIDALMEIGEMETARHYYWGTVTSFEKMSANIWRDWFLREIKKKYHRLAGKRPAHIRLHEHAAKAAQILRVTGPGTIVGPVAVVYPTVAATVVTMKPKLSKTATTKSATPSVPIHKPAHKLVRPKKKH